jgi:DNA-binding response OmpR family regulator
MSGRRKILVIDDEAVIRDLLTKVLERANYDVIVARDGLSGVEKAASEKPDLVITDGLLPKLHGFLVCKAIKKMNPAPKVILLTGIYTKLTYKWEAQREYCADDLLTKPVKPGDLLACVEKHLAGLPVVMEIEPLQSASIDQSSAIRRWLASELHRPSEARRPAGYSASWKPRAST